MGKDFNMHICIRSQVNSILTWHIPCDKNSNKQKVIIFTRLSARCRCKLGNFSEVGVLAIFHLTTPLNDCRMDCNGRYYTYGLSLFNLLRRTQLVKRLLIGQKYNHVANVNSESTKELLKWQNSALRLAYSAWGKICDFALLTSSGGKFYEFFMTMKLAIPALTVKNRAGGVLIQDCALKLAIKFPCSQTKARTTSLHSIYYIK